MGCGSCGGVGIGSTYLPFSTRFSLEYSWSQDVGYSLGLGSGMACVGGDYVCRIRRGGGEEVEEGNGCLGRMG